LFVAGGISNLFDRVVQGSVIDFMHVGVGSVRTGIFNVADLAILLGGILMATTLLPGVLTNIFKHLRVSKPR
jgi:signal peptidase II